MREILRAAFKTGSGSAISMILGAISSKIMAVVTGPIGIGLYSMLTQILSTASITGSIGGGGTALTQGVAGKKGGVRDELIRTVFWIFVAGALLVAVSLMILAPWIASVSLGGGDEASIGLVRWVALPVVLTVGLTYLNSVLNGFLAIGRLALIQMAGAAMNAIISYPISIMANTGYPIAFVGMMSASTSVQIIVALLKVRAHGYIRPIWSRGFRPRIERASASSFFKMAGTLLITGVFSTVVLLVIRSLIVQYDGLAEAGIFNVAWVICMMYPMIALGSFGTYFFPALSRLEDPQKRIDLMRDMFRISTLIITPMLVVMILLKPLVVDIMYSNQFYASLDIIRWMLIGVYLKTASWVVSMPVVAFPNMRVYFWTENLWYVGLLTFSLLAVIIFGSIEIIGIGFLVIYALFLAYYKRYARIKHGFTLTKGLTISWFSGLFLVIFASGLTWTGIQINWSITAFLIAATILYMWLSLSREERKWLVRLVDRPKE